MPGASAEPVSQQAIERGRTQVGSLGAGNHFIELQVVDEVRRRRRRRRLGRRARADRRDDPLGLARLRAPDLHRPPAAHGGGGAPLRLRAARPPARLRARRTRRRAQDYLAAMAAAANFAFANRQVMMHEVRLGFEQVFGRPWERLGVDLLYDVAHNIAKLETHEVDGVPTPVWVHRKGATRAFGPGHPDLPPVFRETGQPVIIPGDMGTESWLLVGTERAMARELRLGLPRRRPPAVARRRQEGQERRRGARASSRRRASSCARSRRACWRRRRRTPTRTSRRSSTWSTTVGLARKVARLKPLGVLKG